MTPGRYGSLSRESTKPTAVLTLDAQTSIDPPDVIRWVGTYALRHEMILSAVGAESSDELMRDYAAHESILKKYSPATHLDASDPPAILQYGRWRPTRLPPDGVDHAIHHPAFGVRLKELADKIGHDTQLHTSDSPQIPHVMDPRHPWSLLFEQLRAPPPPASPGVAAQVHARLARLSRDTAVGLMSRVNGRGARRRQVNGGAPPATGRARRANTR